MRSSLRAQIRVALVFDNYGPYHVARLSALTRECTVCPIEIHGTSTTYLWGEGTFQLCPRETLFGTEKAKGASSSAVKARLHRAFNRFSPDVLAVPGWSARASLLAINWAQKAKIPVIMMSETSRHDSPRIVYKEWIKRRVIEACSGAIVGGAPHWSYLHELGMPNNRIVDGYDTVDNEHFSVGAAEARREGSRLRSREGLPDQFFLASSRFIPRKNLIHLIAAYDQYLKLVSSSERRALVIVGYGDQEPAMQLEIKRRHLTPHIHIAGFQPYTRLPRFYGLADAFIHPAITEPWGLVVNEAMAAGLPVVVSNTCGCAPDLVVDGVTGFQIDPQDGDQLATVLAQLSRDSDLRTKLSLNARARIAEWSPKRFGRNLARVARLALGDQGKTSSLLTKACLQALLCP